MLRDPPGRTPRPEVTLCIPTYRSQNFIHRTLGFASGQTFEHIRILVSVDKGDDDTAQVCRDYAAHDPRIAVFEQETRLGWVGNVNFLLDRVETPFFFIYFHDDIIVPQYTVRLLTQLRQRPDAVSIHCDMVHFGGSDLLSTGLAYEGSAARRLMTFLVAPARGSPLRSLTRSSALPRLRLPTDVPEGYWANEPYLMRLVAEGPALCLAETLYLRWAMRAGSLTHGWAGLTPETMLSAFRSHVAHYVQVIEASVTDPSERGALLFALLATLAPRVRTIEHKHGVRLLDRPNEFHPAFRDVASPSSFAAFGPEIERWSLDRFEAFRRSEQQARQTP